MKIGLFCCYLTQADLRTFWQPIPAGGLLLLLFLAGPRLYAGGSGLNTVVVVNQATTNSIELGNYFRERRQVPAENVLRINWAGGNLSWNNDQFQTNLLGPLLGMLAERQLTGQVDYVVLSMDIPFQTTLESSINSTTSALFYGVKNNYGDSWLGATNSYVGSEAIFSEAPPASAPGCSFLTTMITANSLAEAKQIVDQGVAGDGTFAARQVILDKSADIWRNVRYHFFDNAIFNARLRGNYAMTRTVAGSTWGQTNLLGYQTGQAYFSLSPGTFVPGAMADSLTSYGGLIFGQNDQTTLLAFLTAGAAGSYGTVTEPSPSPEKFPNPQNYFFQARGFSLAECYYQSLDTPYEGLVAGEPLSAPFARPGAGAWTGVVSNALLRGAARLGVVFSAVDREHPLQKIDLFVDGKYDQTLTNVAPWAGNLLTVFLNGCAVTYTVPTNANLAVVASGLTDALNNPAVTNLTGAVASRHGDRIELRSLAADGLARTFYFRDNAPGGTGTHYYRARYLAGPIAPQLTAAGRTADGAFRLQVETPTPMACSIQASTDLATWTTIFTNRTNGAFDFVDTAARSLGRRFYRVEGTVAEPRPRLSPGAPGNGQGFRLHVEPGIAQPYVIQASTNLRAWVALFTNVVGGPMDYVDAAAGSFSRRFYRVVTPAVDPHPRLSLLPNDSGGFRLHIQSATEQPYVIQASTNLFDWSAIGTNAVGGAADVSDARQTEFGQRFYRALLLPRAAVPPIVAPVGGSGLLGVTSAALPYLVEVSTDLVTWRPLVTNLYAGKFRTAVGNATGGRETLTTFVTASRGAFLDSAAFGSRACNLSGTVEVGSGIQLDFYKTNGAIVSVAATNQFSGGAVFDLGQQLCARINAAVDLQGDDGVVAEDLAPGWLGAVRFTLRARSPGCQAGLLQVRVSVSANLVFGPAPQFSLNENLSDLQPRNHLYVTAGMPWLALAFPLDTTRLADGFHELAAVAYEGSHVRTQTRATLPVRVQNTPLSANLAFLDFGDTAPVAGTYHIQVTANTNTIRSIRLFSTGGCLGAVTNQASATFAVDGRALGAGLHPFYALIESSTGPRYRTQTRSTRLVAQ
jgi:uncharacterized protein (TIGR03790 family)